MRRRHVTAAAARKGHHRCHRHPAGASSRGAPAEGGIGGRTGSDGAVAGRRPTIRADGIEPLAKSFGACPVRADAAAAAAVPSTSAQPAPAGGPDDRGDDRHPERSAGPPARSVPCRQHQAPTGADQRARDARRRTRPARWSGPGECCGGYSGYSEDTAADTCPRRSPRPAAFTAKTPKHGLEIRRLFARVLPGNWPRCVTFPVCELTPGGRQSSRVGRRGRR
jgi:hypothetical protein